MNGNGADLVAQMKECAIFLYQNREQKAYETLQCLLPQINHIFQKMNECSEVSPDMINVVIIFLEAIKRKHTLALADLLAYDIPQLFREIEMENQS